MSRQPNQWPDPAVLWRRPRPTRRTSDGWLRAVADADWLWRHGMDTVDIAAALGLHERDALRAVAQGREARRAVLSARPVQLVSYPVDVEDG